MLEPNPNFNEILAKALADLDKVTNYDWLCKMCEEDFAEFIVLRASEFVCPPGHHECIRGEIDGCEKCWVAWLKQEHIE